MLQLIEEAYCGLSSGQILLRSLGETGTLPIAQFLALGPPRRSFFLTLAL